MRDRTWNPTPGRDLWLMPLSLNRPSRGLFFARSKTRCLFVKGIEHWSAIVLCFLAAKNHSNEFLERSVDYIQLRSWFLLFVWLNGFRQVYFLWLGTWKSILFDPWSHRVCCVLLFSLTVHSPLFSFVGVERPTQRISDARYLRVEKKEVCLVSGLCHSVVTHDCFRFRKLAHRTWSYERPSPVSLL